MTTYDRMIQARKAYERELFSDTLPLEDVYKLREEYQILKNEYDREESLKNIFNKG